MKYFIASCIAVVSALAFSATQDLDYKLDLIQKTSTSWAGQPIKYPSEEGRAEVTTATITIKKGQYLPWHKHEVPMVVYVMQGELTIEDESGEKAIFFPGETAVESVNVVHRGYASGNVDTKLFAIYFGTSTLKNTVVVATPDLTHKH